MAIRFALPLAVLTLAACSSPDELGDKVGVKRDASAQDGGSTARAQATANGGAHAVKEATDLYEFGLSWPREVGAIPALAAKLEADGRAARKKLISEAQDDRKLSKEDDIPFRPHSYSEEWKVVANLPDWLSLTDDFYSFSGGAHGIYGRETLVWDKQAGTSLKGVEMFSGPDVLQAALGDRLCDALNAERVRRRGADYEFGTGNSFDDCPGVDEASVIVGSSNRKTFDRIAIWYGPYVAGPYAEGSFELNFPVDAKVLDAVKPAYRSGFSIKR